MRTGTANLPLHSGKCPAWLFEEMKQLSTGIIRAIIYEYGPAEVLKRLSDPYWFQALGCVLGFDWHSSGVTTTVCGALKDGLKPYQKELGIYFAGGKGKTSRKTPQEIDQLGEKYGLPQEIAHLKLASKMAAKVDSAALQDGFNLYHHFFVFTGDGKWSVVQQGMNDSTRYARRYHWLSEGLKSFVCEPHNAIASDIKSNGINLVALESENARLYISNIARENPDLIYKELQSYHKSNSKNNEPMQLTMFDCLPEKRLDLPPKHEVPVSNTVRKILYNIYEKQPDNFEQILAMPGVGPGTVRALTMVAEIVYGAKVSFRDPARYSFAHGGKDGYPFPVDRETYHNSIQTLKTALNQAQVGNLTKIKALKKLSTLEIKD